MGLKKNIAYSSLLTVANYIFPFITFPYITRVLGVEKFGLCNFYNSIVSYFMLFAMMGMSSLAVREIARCKGNKAELNKTFSSLSLLNGITTVLSVATVLLSLLFVDKFQEHPQFIIIGAISILFNFLLFEWLFRGLEDFSYITIRSIAIRVIYVIAVFVFVKNEDDYLVYFLLTSFIVVVNAIVNLLYTRKVVVFSLEDINLRCYVKPYIIFGAYQLLTSMYTSFNVAYLGFVCDDIEVGYYSASVKLFNILLSFYTAFSGVLLPRMSQMIEVGDSNGFQNLLKQSLVVLYSFAIPILIFTEVFTKDIVSILAGSGFEGAIMPMKIVMPLVLIIGIEQVLIYQILMPLKKDNQVFVNSCLGALTGVLLNVLLVPRLMSLGSAIVWLSSEMVVLCCAYIYVNKLINVKEWIFSLFVRKFIYYIPFVLLLITIANNTIGTYRFFIGIVSCIVYWCGVEFFIDKKYGIKKYIFKTNIQ